MRGFGDRLKRGGKEAEEVGNTVEDVGRALTGIVGGNGEPQRPPARKRTAPPRPALRPLRLPLAERRCLPRRVVFLK